MANTKKHTEKSAKEGGEDVKKGATIDLGGFSFGGLFNGIGNLIDLVTKLEKEGTIHREKTILGKTPSGKEMRGVYGFTVRTGLGKDGPRIEHFGNIKHTKKGPVVEEVREPLIDVFEEKDQVVVIAEMPGVAEGDITIALKGMTLTIEAAEGGKKKYLKEMELPAAVEATPASRSYKNGVMELRFNKMKK